MIEGFPIAAEKLWEVYTEESPHRRWPRAGYWPLIALCLLAAGATEGSASVFQAIPRPWSLLALVAVLAEGPAGGLVVAVAGAIPALLSQSYGLPGWQLAFSVAEVLFIGLLVRRGMPVMGAALLFWTPLGAAACWRFPALVNLELVPPWMAAFGGAAAGLVMAATANLIMNFDPVARWLRRPGSRKAKRELRSEILDLALFAAGSAVIFVMAFHSQMFDRFSETEAERGVVGRAKIVRQLIGSYLQDQRAAIQTLASGIGILDDLQSPAADHLLQKFGAANSGFLTLVLAAPDGKLITAFPPTTPDGRDIRAQHISVADRQYFRVASETRKPFVSGAFRGRGLGNQAIVAVSAPVITPEGKFLGVIEGSLNLNGFNRLEPPNDDGRMSLLILDSGLNVVYRTEGMPYEVLSNLRGAPVLEQWLPRDHVAFRRRCPDGTECLITAALVPGVQWRVILQRSMNEAQERLQIYRVSGLAVLMLILALSARLTTVVSRHHSRPLENLAREVSSFGLAVKEEVPLEEPADSSLEVSILIASWNRLTRRLRDSHDRLQQNIQALEEERRRAEAADHAKSRFLANMSHELRTPLNGIIGTSELLLGDNLSSEHLSQTRMMRQSADRLLRTIDDILDMTRLESGQLEVGRARFCVCEIVDEIAHRLASEAESKGLESSCTVAPGIPPEVVGDGNKIRQVLLTLVENAVKFTPSGRVDLAVTRFDSRGGTLEIEFRVADTGVGISKAVLAHLFEPFFQADNSARRGFGGTGLGLAIAKQIVELMGGQIGVDSTAGRGASFWFRVPFEVVPTEPRAIEPAPPAAAQGETRILVAEDHPINQTVARRMLERLGYAVDIAADGERAVEAARTHSYAAVLMDIQMPRMDGLEATAAIRSAPGLELLPIIAMTTGNLPGDRETCIAAGMNDYVAKPISFAVLAPCLERWVGRSPESDNPALPGSPKTAGSNL